MKNAAWIPVRSVLFLGATLWAAACGDPTEPNRVPAAVGSIPAQTVFVADTVGIVVSGYFSDPDGDALSYAAQSSGATAVSVTVSADTVRVIGVEQGTATVTVTATDPDGQSATQSFSVTVPNRAPEAVDSIAAMETYVGESGHVVVTAYFSDPDGDVLSYAAESSDEGVTTPTVSGDTVWVAGTRQGTAIVTVTATDPGGLSATQSFSVTVPNRVPEAVDSIPAVKPHIGQSAPVVAPAYFSDPDGDALSFTAEASDTGVVTAIVSGDTVLVVAVTKGSATVTVTASDPGGLTARQSFAATVANRAPAAVDSIPAVEKYVGKTGSVVVSAYFSDPDGDALSYAVESSDTGVVTAAISGDTVRVVAVAQGSAIVTVAASDPEGLFAEQSFAVTVPNRAPEVVDSIPAIETIAEDHVTVIVSGHFSDPDGDSLSYAAESSDTGVAAVSVFGEEVRIAGVAEGGATVTVTASDRGGLSVGLAFPVKVGPDPQPAILEAFYEATGGADWENNDKWLTDAPIHKWHGVEVNDRGRVTSLLLRDNNLEGTIPPELGGLSSLKKLFLAGNNLEGTFPPSLGNLSSLKRLDLSRNGLTGGIPAELGDLTSLVFLSLHSNGLTGTIPPEIGRLSELDYLHLGLNELEGSIPAGFGRLTKLEVVFLSTNKLSGSLPPELGNLSSAAFIDLADNEISGTIPPELGDLDLLDAFDVSKNRLHGPLPSNFVKLKELDRLTFSDNDGLCAPRNPSFSTWLRGVKNVDGPRCGDADRKVLKKLYNAAGGRNWKESDGWLQAEDLGDWYGVKTDSVGYVLEMDLEDNGLRGTVPFEIGDLETVGKLEIGTNDLSGPLPLRMTGLRLERFGYADTGLCELDDEEFREWLDDIPSLDGTGLECLDPREALAAFYDATGGTGWTKDRNWNSDAPLDEWFGIETDEDGQVTAIELIDNGLVGHLPPELGDLPRLERLALDRSYFLNSPMPPELGKLSSLRVLDLGYTALTGTIPPELGDLPRLEYLRLERNNLSGPIPPELGKLSSLRVLDLDRNILTGTIPPELGDLREVSAISLYQNRLTGSIPGELGKPPELFQLLLYENRLTGSIPPELGNLSELYDLWLQDNQLTGSIPPELGNLSGLRELWLNDNRLTGSIPGELGRLSQLLELHVVNNDLSGSLPSELGDLSRMRGLYLTGNDFSGTLPAEFARLDRLQDLGVANNPKLAGPIPRSFTRLENVKSLIASETGLCAPDEATFLDWLKWIPNRRVRICGHDNSGAYLIQSIQERDVPVPLVSDRKALLRVFVTATRETDETIPPVVARFYRNGSETYEVTIPGKSVAIPTEVDEGSLDKSSNVTIPDTVVRPGLEMVVEIDPDDTLDEDLLVRKRLPEEGRLKFELDSMPAFDLTLVPFLWEEDPDSSVLEFTDEMAEEDEEHELLRKTYDMLPVEGLNVSAHDPVESSSNDSFELLKQVGVMREMEKGSGYWMGSMTGPIAGPAGIAYVGGKTSFSRISSSTIAHELGHNLNNRHAPGCFAPGADPSFPEPDGSIGAWGYNHRAGKLVSPSTADFMTYCRPRWVSDYFFDKMVRHRLIEAEDPGSPSPFAEGPGILLWGGIDAKGEPSLEPAFVVDAPGAGPPGPGPYTLTGRDAAGARLFSISFDMEEIADADGETAHFAFVLPVEPEWATSLASITLAAPDGSATLDGDTDAPMAIVRDVRSGQVRAFWRGLSERPVLPAGFEVYWSRGIPDREEWVR